MNETSVLEELLDREPLLHRRHHGESRAALEAVLAQDFFEIGASGAIYEREAVIRICLERYAYPETLLARPRNPRLLRLSEDLWQICYDLTQGARETRRTTLWRRAGSAWQIVFHQGTVIT